MNIFEAVKQSVTTRQAAESYGIRVNKNGMAVCPFHRDKNPSMKVDRRFHCFGCQADGDVIDFTAHLYNLKPKEAAEKLARDFSIHYENMGHSPPQRKQIKRQLTQEQRYLQAENRYFRALADYLHLLKQWKESEQLLSDFAELSKKIDISNIIAVLEMTNKRDSDLT